MQRVFFVVNPGAAGGKARARWLAQVNDLRARFPKMRWAFTSGPGIASRLAAKAWEDGAEQVVAVGGDGTVNEVVNGLMGNRLGNGSLELPLEEGAPWSLPDGPTSIPELGVIPVGTGCDFVKTIGVPKDLSGALDVLESGRRLMADVGKIDLRARSGEGEVTRYFINIGGAGASGEVVDRVNRSGKRYGGFVSFLLATAATSWAYHTPRVWVKVDDAPPRAIDLNVIFVCNAQYCGGGMHPGVRARLDDGYFDVVELSAIGRFESFFYGGRLYTGSIEGVPGGRAYRAKRLELTSEEDVLAESDGEQPGITPAVFTILERVLPLRVGDACRNGEG